MLRKGREGIRGRQTKQIDAPSFIGSQIISEMFILIFMTLHVLTLFTFPICVATINSYSFIFCSSQMELITVPHTWHMLSSLGVSAHELTLFISIPSP